MVVPLMMLYVIDAYCPCRSDTWLPIHSSLHPPCAIEQLDRHHHNPMHLICLYFPQTSWVPASGSCSDHQATVSQRFTSASLSSKVLKLLRYPYPNGQDQARPRLGQGFQPCNPQESEKKERKRKEEEKISILNYNSFR